MRAGGREAEAGGNGAAPIDLRVQLQASFGPAEVRPGKERERQVNRRGVQRVGRVRQFQAELFPGVERAGAAQEALGQRFPHPPISPFIGLGQSRFGHRLAEAQVIEGLGPGIQAGGDIAQAFPPGQLRKGHGDELLAAAKVPDARLGSVPLNETIQGLAMKEIEDLRKNEAAGVHRLGACPNAHRASNASHAVSPANECSQRTSRCSPLR